MWCFGTSAEGELGVRTTTVTSSPPIQLREQPWDKLALGTSFTCGIQTGGALYCWGRNTESQLGVGGQAGLRTPGRVCLP
jgi:alpha-tubulin suppressor-like RCC1 family protein